jgi:hypothetical protein
MANESETQDQGDRRRTAVDIAVLKTEVLTLGREMSELKRVNSEQSAKLDAVLLQLSAARGGLRTMLWLGASMAGFGGAVVWIIQHLISGRP